MVKPPLTLQLEDAKTQGFSSYSNIILLTICLETKNSWLGRLVSAVIYEAFILMGEIV